MSAPKRWEDYKDLAQWIVLKTSGVDTLMYVDSSKVRFVASELADAYNAGYDASIIENGKFSGTHN